jgi:hypothetical protein
MYYYVLPMESMAGAFQLLCYLFTLLAAALTCIMARS